MNPFLDNRDYEGDSEFYQSIIVITGRRFIIGINPSHNRQGYRCTIYRYKRLESSCGIRMESARTHEVSSVFVYDMIETYGGTESFYNDFYINSPFPLAIIRESKDGNWLNANYYDDPKLFKMVKGFMIESLKKHIDLGLDTSEVFILGKKNADFIAKLNAEEKMFDKLPLLSILVIFNNINRDTNSYILISILTRFLLYDKIAA